MLEYKLKNGIEHTCVMAIMKRDFNENGIPNKIRNYFSGKKYSKEDLILEVESGSDIGKKVYFYYVGYLE